MSKHVHCMRDAIQIKDILTGKRKEQEDTTTVWICQKEIVHFCWLIWLCTCTCHFCWFLVATVNLQSVVFSYLSYVANCKPYMDFCLHWVIFIGYKIFHHEVTFIYLLFICNNLWPRAKSLWNWPLHMCIIS